MCVMSRGESTRFGWELKWGREGRVEREESHPRQVTGRRYVGIERTWVYPQFTVVRLRLPFLRDHAFDSASRVPGERRANGQRRWEKTAIDRDSARWSVGLTIKGFLSPSSKTPSHKMNLYAFQIILIRMFIKSLSSLKVSLEFLNWWHFLSS